jgi:hypothetical protein
MTNLSDYFPGPIDIYSPPMMQSDGLRYLESTGVQLAGNGFTFIATFRAEPSTSLQTFVFVRETTGAATAPLAIEILPSNDGTHPNAIKITVNDLTNSNICTVVSDIPVSDGTYYSLKFEYDATAGTVSILINSVETEDAGYGSRLVTTGTISNDANANVVLFAAWNFASKFEGAIGHCGLVFGTGLAWSDFFNTNNSPKEIDEVSWAAFGSTQPVCWNPYGAWSDNRGSGPNSGGNGGNFSIDDGYTP